MQIQNGNIHWNILFTGPMHDWEVKVVSRFFEFLYSQKVRYGGGDTICLIPSKRKSFDLKSCGESIDHLFLHCEVATEMWSALLQPFGVAWVMP
jgi:hypothetical protein